MRNMLLCAAMAMLGACAASTSLESSWAEPTSGPLAYKKVLVAFPSLDRAKRLSAEVRMKQRIPGAVSANTVFLQGEEKDLAKVKARMRELGIDAVVLMRLIAVDKYHKYVPPSTYTVSTGYDLYGYWGAGWVEVYDPGYTVEKTSATVETNLFDVAGEKLIWTSRSKTLEPKDVPTSIDDIIDANAAAMRKKGLLKG